MCTVEFAGIGIPLMIEIPVHGMMEKFTIKTEGVKSTLQNVNDFRPLGEGIIGAESYIEEI